MNASDVRFATTRDGYELAFTVAGSGFPVVFMPPFTSHVLDIWTEGFSIAKLLNDLACRYQLVNYDSRGMGMSTREISDGLTMDAYLLDLETVLEALDIERFVLVGPKNFALLAANYAVKNPDRVAALILMSAPFRWIPAIWEQLPQEDWDEFLLSRVPRGYSAKLSQQMVEMFDRWTDRETYLSSLRVWEEARLEGKLSELQTPTLVMEPSGNESAVRAAVEVAEMLPRGRFEPIESGYAFGLEGEAIGAIDRFLAREGVRPRTRYGQNGDEAQSKLSRRELEVLRLLVEGKTNAQIADELTISPHTVITHVTRILEKTGAVNRTQAASYALSHGLA